MTNNFYTDKEFIEMLSKKGENKNFDFKEKLNWKEDGIKDEKLEVIKDFLGMANTMDGGKIIFGVKDGAFEPIGLSDIDFESFDQTDVNNLLNVYAEPKFSVSVCKYELEMLNEKKKFVLIDVPEFTETPIICKKSAHSSKQQNKQILKEGGIYVRTDKASTEIIPSYFEMKELLHRAIIKNSDELLRNIKNLINGKSIGGVNKISVEKFNDEIKSVDDFFKTTIDNHLPGLGFWKIVVVPERYKEIFSSQKEVEERIKNSEVELRGWNFPHTDRDKGSNCNSGFQSYTIWERYVEAYRAYQSGLFIWKRAIWEDIDEKVRNRDGANQKVLSFISAIYSATEFFLFLSRYYRDIGIEKIVVKIELNGLKDRMLASLEPGVYVGNYYIARDDSFVYKKEYNITEITVNHKEIALEFIKKLFLMFNCSDMADKIIDSWQVKLINRRV